MPLDQPTNSAAERLRRRQNESRSGTAWLSDDPQMKAALADLLQAKQSLNPSAPRSIVERYKPTPEQPTSPRHPSGSTAEGFRMQGLESLLHEAGV